VGEMDEYQLCHVCYCVVMDTTNKNDLIIRWTKDEVVDFAHDFYDETLDISEDEWVTALEQFADEVGLINEQIWEHITNIIKTNKGEQQ
jgi:hypothetical protein